ncbi:hypothetical protein GB931_09840 [Modestobacter sp. I12A-02628]|uniref:Uncharacterized protein n=1 Tax=Goekera deserti TaxID=2497753 RepID=A0A7K3WCW4_9ACTN|nr:hypothetical protein [Goekera deserti]MPQ98215.1 hypothetical protein [Goekera deserti]NDI48041.1 hypothetical protein [Goekera deserti]NEL53789.1 hypothetical protein [Goekera deserti]
MLRGEIYTLYFDGRRVVTWWGPGDDDLDRFAVRAGRVLAWPDEEACAEYARRAGWQGLDTADGASPPGRSELDVEAAQAWLRGRSAAPDPAWALEVWNAADDLTRTVGSPPQYRDQLAERCYRKLVAANVPGFFDLASFQPRWSARELRCLRRVLGGAVHLFRTALRE